MLDLVVYGPVSTFLGPTTVALYVVDGVVFTAADPEEAHEYAKQNPDKWVRASTNPACGVLYTFPVCDNEQPHQVANDLPFEWHGADMTLQQALS